MLMCWNTAWIGRCCRNGASPPISGPGKHNQILLVPSISVPFCSSNAALAFCALFVLILVHSLLLPYLATGIRQARRQTEALITLERLQIRRDRERTRAEMKRLGLSSAGGASGDGDEKTSGTRLRLV